jgi:hypothetical protein
MSTRVIKNYNTDCNHDNKVGNNDKTLTILEIILIAVAAVLLFCVVILIIAVGVMCWRCRIIKTKF